MGKHKTIVLSDHEKKINALIPEAVRIADEMVELLPMHERSEIRVGKNDVVYRHNFWTEYFHTTMDKLTRKAGLRV